MEVNIFQVDAFTQTPFGGNPAAVVTNSKGLSEDHMQKIANEMNLSETAFIRQLDDCYFRIRYFTPICEVDLCGHATIAAAYTLANKGYIKPIEKGSKVATIETKVGPLQIEILFENYLPVNVMMDMDSPKYVGEVKDIGELLSCFGLQIEDVGTVSGYIPPEMVSTGLPDIMLPIRDKDVLMGMKVDFCRLKDLSDRLGVTGVHAFYLEDENTAHARNFAPAVGIDEEAATGTANGALIYYLKMKGLLAGELLLVHQGESLKRPSLIKTTITGSEDKWKVRVGGAAKVIMEGIMKF